MGSVEPGNVWYPGALRIAGLCAAGCKVPIDTSKDKLPAWAVGGTLHDALWPHWARGSDEDTLATAGQRLYEALWRGHLQTDEEIVVFREKAMLPVRMTDDSAHLMSQVAQYKPNIYSASIRSLLAEGMDEADEFNKHMGPASMEAVRPN